MKKDGARRGKKAARMGMLRTEKENFGWKGFRQRAVISCREDGKGGYCFILGNEGWRMGDCELPFPFSVGQSQVALLNPPFFPKKANLRFCFGVRIYVTMVCLKRLLCTGYA